MYNGHADVTVLLDAATVVVAASYYYDAFGNILEETGSVDNPIRYAGYQYDKETELYYLNARMYDPKIARFLQEDTYRGKRNDPLSLHLYAYCVNNPIKYYDPTGRTAARANFDNGGVASTLVREVEKENAVEWDPGLGEGKSTITITDKSGNSRTINEGVGFVIIGGKAHYIEPEKKDTGVISSGNGVATNSQNTTGGTGTYYSTFNQAES